MAEFQPQSGRLSTIKHRDPNPWELAYRWKFCLLVSVVFNALLVLVLLLIVFRK